MGNKKENNVFLFVVFLTFISFLIRLYFMTQFSLIYGDDGPYYLLQTKNLLSGGEGKFESLIFYFFAMSVIVFNDLTLGIKIAASILSALTIIPIFFIVRHITKDKEAALFAAFLALISPMGYNILSQTLKEVGGLLVGTTLFYFVVKYFDKISKKESYITLLIIFILSVTLILTHLSSSFYFMSFICLSLLCLFFYSYLSKNQELRSKSILLLFLLLLSVFISFGVRSLLGSNIPITSIFYSFENLLNESKVNDFSSYSIFLMYLFYFPFVFIYLSSFYNKSKSASDILLICWLAVGIILIQSIFIDPNWTWRFSRMDYIIMIILASAGFSIIRNSNQFLSFVLLTALIFWEFAFFISFGVSFNPIITESEFTFLENTHKLLPSNTVIISVCGEHHSFPCKTNWLSYVGFNVIKEEEILPSDYPVLFIETKLENTTLNPSVYYYNSYNYSFSLSDCYNCGKILYSYGRFSFVEYIR